MTNTIKQILGEDILGAEDTDTTADEFTTDAEVSAYHDIDLGTTRQYRADYPGGTHQARALLLGMFNTVAASKGVSDDDIKQLKVKAAVHFKLRPGSGDDDVIYGVITVTGPQSIIIKFGDWLDPIEF